MEDLKRKEVEKAEAKKEKEAKRFERERKKKIREEKQLEREHKKAVREEKRKQAVSSGRKTRSRKNSAKEKGIDVIAALHLLSSSSDEDGDSSQGDSEEDNTMCPKCGIRYGNNLEQWICCDGCGMWVNKKCTNINRRVPKVFCCERCAI